MKVYQNHADKIYEVQKKGLEQKASDLFLASGQKPSFKIRGKVVFDEKAPVLEEAVLLAYLQNILTDRDYNIFKEELELNTSVTIDDISRFRVNAIHHLNGICITMRYIPAEIPTFEDLNLPEALKQIIDFPNGLVLITGPMGAGKTTTLACLINMINRHRSRHILTVEDPIEYLHQNQTSMIEQREVGVHTKSFSAALKSSLRSATDVILLGEMRDLETMSLAMTAAETGNLVLATAHTNGAQETIDRLIDVFPSNQQNQIRQQLSSSLRAVVWQHLLPSLQDQSARIPAFEIMFKNYAIANLIRDGKTHQIKSTIQMSGQQGMMCMEEHLKILVESKAVSKEEALNILPLERRNDLEHSLEESHTRGN
ncbi:MAG TPA: PilT/PilU family type 4a pilus ATPase [Candidatus Gracilibacteria bacterium]